MNQPLVYVIDDDEDLIQIVNQRFHFLGCITKTFLDPILLYKAMQEKTPDLLIVDLNLGNGLSGLDIISKIRSGYPVTLPILVLSANDERKTIAQALELGANDYIVKPPMRPDFDDIIARFVTTSRLPEPSTSNFQEVNIEKSNVSLTFKLAIEEIHLSTLILVCDHLIKKGTLLTLAGSQLHKILPNCPKIFGIVSSSNAVIISNQKKYQIEFEIDSTQTLALGDIRHFLNEKYGERIV